MDNFDNSNIASGIARVLDASLNRANEGLRVLEDIARMLLNNHELTHELKSMRHQLERFPLVSRLALLTERNSGTDIGPEISVGFPREYKDILSLVTANARRAEQALRTIEEIARLPSSGLESAIYESMRYSLYTLEKSIFSALSRYEKRIFLRGLYTILDSSLLGGRNHFDMAKILLENGVKVIQLREKQMPSGKLLELACSLRKLCDSYQALFIVNDCLDIALASGTGGLHLGQEDLPVTVARKHLPLDTIIGVSVASVKEAKKAESDGADYISPQAIFETHSKECPLIGLDALRAIRSAVSLPVVAIGGINIDNITHVIDAGADSAAVITSITLSADPGQVVRELIGKFSPKLNC